jgi:hypothetical protein
MENFNDTVHKTHSRGGSALLLTILVVSLLMVIVLSLTVFVRMELRTTQNRQVAFMARANARLGLHIALSELQRSVGPDQRFTARADIGEGDDTDNNGRPDNREVVQDAASYGLSVPVKGARNWTGVWGYYEDEQYYIDRPALFTWLVSGNENADYRTSDAVGDTFGQTVAFPEASPMGTPAEAVTPTSSLTYNPRSLSSAEQSDLALDLSSLDPLTINGSDAVLLVGPNSLAADSDPANGDETLDYVVAPKVTFDNGDASSGYAWWVGDEGIKAHLEGVDPRLNAASNAEKRLRSMTAPRSGVETITGLDFYDPFAVPTNASAAADPEQLAFLSGDPDSAADNIKRRFHDLASVSYGVLSNSRSGGLKRDLTAGLLSASPPAEIDDDVEIFGDLIPSVNLGQSPARLPSWGALRSYVQLQNSLSGDNPTVSPRPTTDTQMGIYPVIARFQIWMAPGVDTTGTSGINQIDALYIPSVVLWNPYDVTIEAHTYEGEFFTNVQSTGDGMDENYADTDTSSTRMPAYLVLSSPSGGEPYTSGHMGYGGWDTSAPIKVTLDCPEIPPGESIIFSLDSNVTLPVNTSTMVPLDLKPGFRPNFWNSPGVVTVSGGNVGGRETVSMARTTIFRAGFSLRLSNGTLLQRVDDNRWSPSYGKTLTYPDDPPLPVGPNPVITNWEKDGGTYGGEPAETFKTIDETNTTKLKQSIKVTPSGNDFFEYPSGNQPVLALGFTTVMEFSGRKFNKDPIGANTGNTFINPRLRWLANYNPAAPEIIRPGNDRRDDDEIKFYDSTPNYSSSGGMLDESATYKDGSVRQNRPRFYPDGEMSSGSFTGEIDRAFNGFSQLPDDQDVESFNTKTILFHLPRQETGVTSIGMLQHANLHPATGILTSDNGYAAASMPAYAIGNSWGDARVAPVVHLSKTNGKSSNADFDRQGIPNWSELPPPSVGFSTNRDYHFDLSFLINKKIWDGYFFSTVPAFGTVDETAFPLPSTAMMLHNPGVDDVTLSNHLQDYEKAASKLLVKGAFNINSTSVEAWKAVLSSTRRAPIVKNDGTTIIPTGAVFSRLPYPGLGVTDETNSATDFEPYSGVRELNDDQVTALAEQIVQSVRNHGPFPSLARFINRNPSAAISSSVERQAVQLVGPLQLAIDRTTFDDQLDFHSNTSNPEDQDSLTLINDHLVEDEDQYSPLTIVGTGTDGRNYFQHASAFGYNRGANRFYRDTSLGTYTAAAGIPGYLTSADLLQSLGPRLSARSDTFKIRAYGEITDSADNIIGRAWCEAIVQRTPEYVESSDDPEVWPPSSPQNIFFGRRFKILSMRWLQPSEI